MKLQKLIKHKQVDNVQIHIIKEFMILFKEIFLEMKNKLFQVF